MPIPAWMNNTLTRGVIPKNKKSKGVWIWDNTIVDTTARTDTVISRCKQAGFTELYLTYDITKAISKYQYFIQKATAAGMDVHALTGDALWALTAYQINGLSVIDSVGAYNSQATSRQKFAAIQFDVEPHQLNGGAAYGAGHNEWNTDRQGTIKQWLDNSDVWIARAHIYNLPLGGAFTYWLDGEWPSPIYKNAPTNLAQVMIDKYDYYAIMAYQNTGVGIAQASDTELQYASTAVQYGYQNAAFLPPDWLNATSTITDAQIQDNVRKLRDYGICYQFCDVASVDATGTLPAAGYGNLARWMYLSRKTDPNQQIIAYMSDANVPVNPTTGATPYFSSTYITNFGNAIDLFMNQGLNYAGTVQKADGIHCDFEPTARIAGLQGFVDMLSTLKGRSHPDTHFSISASANYTTANTIAQYEATNVSDTFPAGLQLYNTMAQMEWKTDFIAKLADVCTHLCPMLYDKTLANAETNSVDTYVDYWYRAALQYIDAIARLSTNKNCHYLPIMPAYTATGHAAHDITLENINYASFGLRKAIAKVQQWVASNPAVYGVLPPNIIHGAAIFYWMQFIGADPGDARDYTPDRQWWNMQWLYHGYGKQKSRANKVVVGIETTDQTPASITFYGKGFGPANDALQYIDDTYNNFAGYKGLAIHDYAQWETFHAKYWQ